MNRQLYSVRPPKWHARPSNLWARVLKPLRQRRARQHYGLGEVDVQGIDQVKDAVQQGYGVLITPNHPSHADPFAMLAAADHLGDPFYFMTAWQVFRDTHFIGRRVLERHGCFSINREWYDLGAFRRAVDVLQTKSQPLVVFPEGDVYHLNDRTMPFRHGAAVAALLASRRGKRPVVCVPCALNYRFTSDPSDHLDDLTKQLEQRMKSKSDIDMPLAGRIERINVAMLGQHERTYLGSLQSGSLADRTEALVRVILGRLEYRYQIQRSATSTTDRIMRLRQHVLTRQQQVRDESRWARQCPLDLEDLFLAGQLCSYPGDYLANNPSFERLAETLDKLEEDVLGVKTASRRGTRRAVVRFGEPMIVSDYDNLRTAAADLTDAIQSRVQAMLDRFHSRADFRSLPTPHLLQGKRVCRK